MGSALKGPSHGLARRAFPGREQIRAWYQRGRFPRRRTSRRGSGNLWGPPDVPDERSVRHGRSPGGVGEVKLLRGAAEGRAAFPVARTQRPAYLRAKIKIAGRARSSVSGRSTGKNGRCRRRCRSEKRKSSPQREALELEATQP